MAVNKDNIVKSQVSLNLLWFDDKVLLVIYIDIDFYLVRTALTCGKKALLNKI